MTISAETKQRFLNEILSIRFLIKEEQSRNTAESLVQFENLLTLDEIENSLISTPLTELADNLTHILSQRWERIRQSTLPYTQQPLNKANRFCFDLALALAPLSTSEDELNDLPFGKGPYFLLMPSLKAHKDIYGDNIHNLQLHEFVLSDDEQLFIPLASCLNHAFESDTGQFVHMVSETDQYPKLTPSELLRVSTHSIGINETYQAILTFNMHRLYGDDLGVKLNDLTIALRAGGSHGQGSGEELNAGAAANEGILAFSTYWDTVEDTQKQQYYYKYPGLKETIGRLMRPTDANYEETKFCVELIADAIDPIITDFNNNKQLLISTRNEVIAQQKLLTIAIKATDYVLLPPTAKTPKILRHIFALEEQHQKDIFKHTTHKSALLYALENEPLALPEYVDLVKKPLLMRGIRTKLSNGDSALIIAAKHGGSDVVELLLALGADSEVLDNDGSNALHWAANNGHTNVMSILLKGNKSLLKTVGANGDTALHFAVKGGQYSAVDYLLEHGANINARNYQGRNAFDIARSEYPELIKPILLKAITQVPKEQRSTLSHVASHNNDNVLLYVASRHHYILYALLENVKLNKQKLPNDILNSTNNKNETPLILAAKKGLNTEVQQLIELGAKTNLSDRHNCNALHWAAGKGHTNVITTLLEHNNALIETKGKAGNTALNFAVMQGHGAALDALLDKDANINSRNFEHQNAIDLAIQHHHHLIKPLLLKAITQTRAEQKALLRNISGGIYNDVLMYAAENDPTLFKALLEHVKERKQILPQNVLNSRNSKGETLLMIAAKEGYETATQLLLELGAATDSVDKRDNNALHIAAKHGRANIVITLLEQTPALIETINDIGSTALHYAVRFRHVAVVDALLAKGANITARNNYGYNALDLDLELQNPSKLTKTLLIKGLTLIPEKQTELLSKVAYGYYDSVITFTLQSQYLNLSEIFPFLPQATQNHINIAQTEMDHFFDFDKHINPLKTKLSKMEEKAMYDSDYITAASVAHSLVHELEMARATFLLAEGGIQERKATFKRSCLYAVERARPVLACHRNWGKMIAAFVLALVTLPVSLPLYLLGFFSTKTNSSQKLNKLEEEIQRSLPEPIAV